MSIGCMTVKFVVLEMGIMPSCALQLSSRGTLYRFQESASREAAQHRSRCQLCLPLFSTSRRCRLLKCASATHQVQAASTSHRCDAGSALQLSNAARLLRRSRNCTCTLICTQRGADKSMHQPTTFMLGICGNTDSQYQQSAGSDPLAHTALNLLACLELFSPRHARLHCVAPGLSSSVRHLGLAAFADAPSVDTKELVLTALAFAPFTELELCCPASFSSVGLYACRWCKQHVMVQNPGSGQEAPPLRKQQLHRYAAELLPVHSEICRPQSTNHVCALQDIPGSLIATLEQGNNDGGADTIPSSPEHLARYIQEQ